ncbi:MAG: regulatory protein RecX [Clostridia bacterium]|nr:regulatory protein RecX [Clostridia bacterium]
MKRLRHNIFTEEAGWQYALKLLGIRQRSEQEINTALQKKGYSQELTIAIINRLKAANLLDDRQFAYNWTNYRLSNRLVGRNRLKNELRQHGISASLAEEVVSTVLTDAIELDNAWILAQRYHQRPNESTFRYCQRLARFLQQRGFSNSIISQVLKKVAANNLIDSDDLI